MKKRKQVRTLSRKKDQRKALLKGLVRSLLLHEKIETTEAKAKETRPLAEKFITKAKKGDISARRYIGRFFSKEITKKLVDDIAPRYKERQGGYTRIIKLGPRTSDGVKTVIIELVK